MDGGNHIGEMSHARYIDVLWDNHSSLLPNKMKLVQAWMELHRDELLADWDLAVSGQHPYKIDPLR